MRIRSYRKHITAAFPQMISPDDMQFTWIRVLLSQDQNSYNSNRHAVLEICDAR